MKRALTILMTIAMLGLTFSTVAAAPAWADEPADPITGCTYYAATGHNLCAGFRAYWEHYGGLAIFGYPITEEYVDEDTGLVTQWFERARFEWHPGEWPERWDVMLGLLGNEYAAHEGLLGSAPFQKTTSDCDDYDWAGGDMSDCAYFAATGHNLSGGFKAYWEKYGGLAVFGYPISEEFVENGMTVQYFERQRFEWHPGEWPERWDVMLGLLGNTLAHIGDEEPQPTMTVVASGLHDPRGLVVDANGDVYVSEAGTGGEDCIEGEGPEGPTTLCFGYTGSVTRIADGEQERVVDDLPSILAGTEAIGTQDVTIGEDGTLYVTIGLGQDPGNRVPLAEEIGDLAEQLGTLVEIGDDDWSVLVDIAAYEVANNPDGGLIDSNPFSLVAEDDGGFVVTDAGANALLHVSAEGEITTLAVFPDQMVDAPPFLELPPGTQIPSQAVPTGVKVGPDGAYYVGELTGFPFPIGGASVWRVVPGEEPEMVATGFTNILDIAFDEDGTLYVLEMASNSLLAAEEDPSGALIRVNDDDSHTVIVGEGLILPTGMDIGPDGAIYVSNMGVIPGQGQVVRIDLP